MNKIVIFSEDIGMEFRIINCGTVKMKSGKCDHSEETKPEDSKEIKEQR